MLYNVGAQGANDVFKNVLGLVAPHPTPPLFALGCSVLQ